MPRTVTAGWLLLAAVLARADDPPKKAPPSPADQLAALKQEYTDAMNAFQKAYGEAKTEAEQRKVFAEKYPQPEKFAAKFVDLAEKYPTDPAALDALTWVVQNGRGQPGGAIGKALPLLKRDHLASPNLGPVCLALTYSYHPSTAGFLRAVLEKNPHRDVQGAACLTLARVLKSHAEFAQRIQEDPNYGKMLASALGSGFVDELKARKPESVTAESERLFERVAKEYADLKSGRGTYGTAAEAELFELRHLAIGKEAPEITGEDIDGLPLRLSDFRGKVVVLDFWGNW